MTLEQFLKPFCVVKDNVIIIKNSKDETLYKIDGLSLHDTKCAYYDIRLKVHIYIDTRDLNSEVTNWGCWQDKLMIYIREAKQNE